PVQFRADVPGPVNTAGVVLRPQLAGVEDAELVWVGARGEAGESDVEGALLEGSEETRLVGRVVVRHGGRLQVHADGPGLGRDHRHRRLPGRGVIADVE